MPKEKIKFIATKYRDQKVRVAFYTKKGERVSFNSVEKVPVKGKVEFFAKMPKK